MDYCKYEKIGDDIKNWVVDNGDVAIGMSGWPTRLIENAPFIAEKMWDLHKIWKTDDFCFSDAELIEEVSHVVEDIVAIKAHVHGFDLKWNPDKMEKHIPKKEFKKDVKEITDNVTENRTVCPFIKAWKDFKISEISTDSVKEMLMKGLQNM